ncbi:MAG: hypothetical protein IIB38_02185 [Candidatus Hydrogenedentes bacterium]|nr:hypothetical protein [Candidatus Hydrogenedentota bacterium]
MQEAYASLHGYQRQAIAATSLAMALILGLSCGFVWNRLKIAAANEKLNIAYRLIKKRKDQMEEELNIGREIQMSMIPLTFPAFPDRKEFSIYAMLQPAREVVREMVNTLRPASEELECSEYLDRVLVMADQPNWSQRQVQIYEELGDPVELVRRMTDASRL